MKKARNKIKASEMKLEIPPLGALGLGITGSALDKFAEGDARMGELLVFGFIKVSV